MELYIVFDLVYAQRHMTMKKKDQLYGELERLGGRLAFSFLFASPIVYFSIYMS